MAEFRTGWVERFMGGSARAEALLVQKFMKDIHKVQRNNQNAARAQRPGRAFHAKSHIGVTNAVFHILPDIPSQLQIGSFVPGENYRAAVRLSNAAGVAQPDQKRDLRGLAVRIFVQGAEFDLLLTNAAASHARDARQFMDFAMAGAGSKLLLIPRLILSVGLLEMIRILFTVLKQTSRKVSSLASEQFWSRAPFALGPYALKFTFAPLLRAEGQPGASPDYLRDDLVERLRKGAVSYDLKIQLWIDEKKTPIEDGVVEWKEADTPPIPLARLTIPVQDLTSPGAEATKERVDRMEFNPWRGKGWFRPLGSLNRARRLVYQSSAEFRQTLGESSAVRGSAIAPNP